MALTKVSRGLLSTSIVDNGNATAITIDSSENVGIGTSSPDKTLHVVGSDGVTTFSGYGSRDFFVLENNQNCNFQIVSNSSNAGNILFSDEGASGRGILKYDHASDFMSFTTAATERMRIDSSGRVGIGVTNPSSYYAKDLVVSAADEGGITIAGGTNDQNYLMFADGTSGSSQYKGYIGYDHPTDMMQMVTHGALRFYNGASGSEMGRFDASGNLLVNRTPAFTTAKMEIQSDAGDASTLALNSINTDGSILEFYKAGNAVGSIGTYSGTLTVNSSYTGIMLDDTNNVLRPTNASGGSRDAIISLGTSSQRFKDIYRSGSTISTSDRNMKQDIRDLTDAERNVAVAAKGLLKAFRFIDTVAAEGDSANIHFGIIAQDLAAAFEAEGLDANDYQVYKSDTFTDDDGNEQTRLGICYENLLAFIIAAI